MEPWLFLLAWVTSFIASLILGVFAGREPANASGRGHTGSLVLAGFASLLPAVTLMLFIVVFVIGGSSNVAQLAGEGGRSLWTLWFHVWPPLFIGNPLAFLVATGAVCLPPYPPRYWKSFACRVSAIIAAGCAWYAIFAFAPDA